MLPILPKYVYTNYLKGDDPMKKIWIVALLVLILLPVTAYVVLFQINRFEFVLELNGQQEVALSVGESYEEQGVRMKLVGTRFFREGIAADGVVSVTGNVDTAVPGEYVLEYRGIYRSMEGFAKRVVTVVDEVPPEITLVSVPGSFTIHGESYQEEGYSAWDAVDGDLTDQVVREELDGIIYYHVTDRAGNRTTICRKPVYVDLTPPVITLLAGETITVPSGTGYTEPGWTVLDNIDGDLSERVEVSGFVDKYLAGSYQLSYTVQDSSGNCAEVFRTVMVQAKGLPETVYPTDKVIYLTFDDGPGPYTQYLLEVLEAYKAKATFFVVNTEYMDVVQDIVEQGHAVGIHSMSHDYREIYASADAYFNDILTMQQVICEKTGVTTWLMRFPGGSSNTVSRFNKGIMTYLTQAVEDMGFQYFDWNVDSMDAGGAKDAKEVCDNVIEGVQYRRISVVLQHDIKGFSVDAVERILQWGIANGYRFLALDMTSPTSHHGVNN